MATTLTLPGLPTSNSETIIQANNFDSGANFAAVDWETLIPRIVARGEHLFQGFPKKKPQSNGVSWTFFERSNMSSGNEGVATVVGIRVERLIHTQAPRNVVASVSRVNLSVAQWQVTVFTWATVVITTTDGQIYHDVMRSCAETSAFVDPETGAYVLPTNGYQMLYEAANFLLTPVAAGAPTSAPIFKAINGRLPLA